MRMKRMGAKTKHSKSSEEFLSQEILFQASQLKRHAAGIYGFGNFLVRARNKIIEIIRKNLEDFGSCEVSLPILQPKFLWENSGRWETYNDNKLMFNFSGRNGEYCLAPTGEEIVLDFAKDNIVSYKDLPINIFQIGNKYRDEIRVRGGILRSKEFLMKDAYSFHSTFEDMVFEYENMKKCYFKIFSDLGMKVVSVKALNSDMGGNVSEEFMCLSSIGEDKVLVNSDFSIALNEEVLQDEKLAKDVENINGNVNLKDFKNVSCLELGHIFQLGQFYSEKMGGLFVDRDGVKKPYFMGCYGIGINRVLGAICENNCDEEGLVWPESVSPYSCVIVCSNDNGKAAEDLYKYLQQKNVEVSLNDREESFGSKIKDCKLLGFPFIIILGSRFLEDGLFEVEERKGSNKKFLSKDELVNMLLKNKVY